MKSPSQGTPLDNDFHPMDSDMSASEDHWGTQMADVVPGPTGGQGQTSNAAPYAVGTKSDSKVKSIGMDTLKGWMGRTQSR